MQLDEIREQRDKKVAMFRKYFGLSIALFYLMAALLIAYLPLDLNISEPMRWGLVVLIGLYSFYRLYRSLR